MSRTISKIRNGLMRCRNLLRSLVEVDTLFFREASKAAATAEEDQPTG